MDIQLRRKDENDSDFLFKLFGEIKIAELNAGSWPQQMQDQLIQMQFTAFEQSVKNEYPFSEDYIILHDSERAGRLQINKEVDHIRVINISLLPAYRNKGIGSGILKKIIQEAESANKPVLLEVDKVNTAVNLYRRLRFEVYEENEIKYGMKYAPSPDQLGEGALLM